MIQLEFYSKKCKHDGIRVTSNQASNCASCEHNFREASTALRLQSFEIRLGNEP